MPTKSDDLQAAVAAFRTAAERLATAAGAGEDVDLSDLVAEVTSGRLNTLERRLDDFISGAQSAGHSVWPGNWVLVHRDVLEAGWDLQNRLHAAKSARARARHDLRQERERSARIDAALHDGGPFGDGMTPRPDETRLRKALHESNETLTELTRQISELDAKIEALVQESRDFVVLPTMPTAVVDGSNDSPGQF